MWQVIWTSPDNPIEDDAYPAHEIFNTREEAETFASENPGDPGDQVDVKPYVGYA